MKAHFFNVENFKRLQLKIEFRQIICNTGGPRYRGKYVSEKIEPYYIDSL